MKIIVLQDYLRSGEPSAIRYSFFPRIRGENPNHESQLVARSRPGGRLADMAGPARKALQPFDTGIDWFGPGLLRTVLGGSPDIVLSIGKDR